MLKFFGEVIQQEMSFESNFTLFSNKDFSSVALSRAVVTEVRKEPSKLNVGC